MAQNAKDVSALYDDFFCNSKEAILMNLNGSKKGYYGLSWYTQGHERYCYLLGIEVGQENTALENAVLKKAPKQHTLWRASRKEKIYSRQGTNFFTMKFPKPDLRLTKNIIFTLNTIPAALTKSLSYGFQW